MTMDQIEALETVTCFLMAEFGPDGHTDGADIVTWGILKTLGYDVEFPSGWWSPNTPFAEQQLKKALSKVKEALTYHPNAFNNSHTSNDEVNRKLDTPTKEEE